MVKGAAKAAGGIASGNFVAVAQGVTEALSPQVLFVIVCVLLFFIMLPIIVICALPQMLFSWATVDDAELIARNQHAEELVICYEETIESQPEGVSPDIYWLISIESARSNQDLDSITEADVVASVENSYTIDAETGDVHNKTPDEIMTELGFDSEKKNWAELMYNTLNLKEYD